MVEIREEDAQEANPAASGSSERTSDPDGAAQQPPNSYSFQTIFAHVKSKPVDGFLWVLRLVTLVFGFLYAFPIVGGPQQQPAFYTKTLLAGAATNLVRLHQRLGGFRLSREFLSTVFLEDSCHYVFFCIIFLGSSPVTMPLLPVVVFAFLHWSSFTLQLMNSGGVETSWAGRLLSRLINNYSQTLLTVIACTEIFIMPLIIVLTFTGRCNLFLPFVYYRFLCLRYMSRRNPHTRLAFQQMRLALEQSVARPGCPPLLQRAVHSFIGFLVRLAPA